MSTPRHRREGGRTNAEWTTLVVSSVILLVVIVLIAFELVSSSDPAAPVAEVDRVVRVGERYGARVTVHNEGDETAANVQVLATLGDEEGDLSIDFLAGGEEQELVFLFDEDPDDGDLSVVVSGFEDP